MINVYYIGETSIPFLGGNARFRPAGNRMLVHTCPTRPEAEKFIQSQPYGTTYVIVDSTSS